jgi:hypothetical protein
MSRISFLLPILLVAACGRAPDPALTQVIAKVESTSPEPAAAFVVVGPCPDEWVCNNTTWYATNALCLASCSGRCRLEEHNNGRCIPR